MVFLAILNDSDLNFAHTVKTDSNDRACASIRTIRKERWTKAFRVGPQGTIVCAIPFPDSTCAKQIPWQKCFRYNYYFFE